MMKPYKLAFVFSLAVIVSACAKDSSATPEWQTHLKSNEVNGSDNLENENPTTLKTEIIETKANKNCKANSSVDRYTTEYLENAGIEPQDFYSINDNHKGIIKKQLEALINNKPDEYNSLCNYNLLLQSKNFTEYSKLDLLDIGNELCEAINVPYISDITINNINFVDNDYIVFDDEHGSILNLYSFEIGNSGFGGTFSYFEYYNDTYIQVNNVCENGYQNVKWDLSHANSNAKSIYDALATATIEYDSEGGDYKSELRKLYNVDLTMDDKIDNKIFEKMARYYDSSNYIFRIGCIREDEKWDEFFIQCRLPDNPKIIGQYPTYSISQTDDLKYVYWGEYKK